MALMRNNWRNLLPVVLALGLLSCASKSEPASPAQIAGMRAKTIAIAPLNLVLALPDELKSSAPLAAKALVEHLEANEKTLRAIDFRTAHALWLEATRDLAKSKEAKNFENAARIFTRKIGEKIDFDVLIIPSLYIQNARIRDDIAYWDSAKQRIEFKGQSRWEIERSEATTIAAASVLIYVLDRDGSVIHTKRTGLELTQHMAIQVEDRKGHDKRTWTVTNDVPALEDENRVRAAMAHSLSPFVSK
jgi:PAS domain-containing protein